MLQKHIHAVSLLEKLNFYFLRIEKMNVEICLKLEYRITTKGFDDKTVHARN